MGNKLLMDILMAIKTITLKSKILNTKNSIHSSIRTNLPIILDIFSVWLFFANIFNYIFFFQI